MSRVPDQEKKLGFRIPLEFYYLNLQTLLHLKLNLPGKEMEISTQNINISHDMVSQKRFINFDLLRVAAMFGIVVLHYFSHGLYYHFDISSGGTVGLSMSTCNFMMSEIVYEICHIAVNCYVMITGYFMITKSFKLSRLAVLWVEVLFYAVSLYAVLCGMGFQSFQVKELINAIFPITFKQYWFMTNYMVLLIFAPVLNVFVHHVSQHKYLLTLIGLGAISLTLLVKFPLGDTFGGGYGFLWFIFLYLVAGYVRLYAKTMNRYGRKAIVAAVITFAYHASMPTLVSLLHGTDMKPFGFSYNGFLFFFSLYVFLWVRGLSIKENGLTRCLVKIAPYTLAVYLISDNAMVRNLLWQKMFVWQGMLDDSLFMFKMLTSCLIIFTICIGIDWCRKQMFELVGINRVVRLTSEKIESVIKRAVVTFASS